MCECGSERIARVSGKTSDMCYFEVDSKERNDYVPSNVGMVEETTSTFTTVSTADVSRAATSPFRRMPWKRHLEVMTGGRPK